MACLHASFLTVLRTLCALLFCISLSAQADVAAKDARGKEIRLSQPASRIIALAPFLTELFYAIDAGGQLVAVSAFSDFPAAARSLPIIGDARRVDIERIITLKPDLVVAWLTGNAAADIQRLEKLGLKVYVAEPRRLNHIGPLMRDLGVLAGRQVPAEFASYRFEGELAEFRQKYAGRTPVRAFVQISARPLMTLNGEHFVSDILALCGGINVFADSPVLVPQVGIEDVLARDPEVIMVADTNPAARDAWAGLTQLQAVRAKRVFLLPPDLVLRPTPRALLGARHVCRDLNFARKR